MIQRPFTRRAFLAGSACTAASLRFAEQLFGASDASDTKPNPALEKLASVALQEAKKQGATYCDIRINRYRDQYCGCRLSPPRGGSGTDEVPFASDSQSFGFGVRVIAKGQWGFAASPEVNEAEIARITREAVTVAKANSVLQAQPVSLAPTGHYVDRWSSPQEKDPFAVPMDEKLELIHGAASTVKKNPKVFSSLGGLGFQGEDKYFASSEGSSIQQYIVQVYPNLGGTAVDLQKNISRERYVSGSTAVAGLGVRGEGESGRKRAPDRGRSGGASGGASGETGKKDLVLLPSHLWLTIHESIGHSTELDRALGYEANFAGTSFLTTEKMGNVFVWQRTDQCIWRPHHR